MIGVPSSAGARRTGQEEGPEAIRAAGLLRRLTDGGLDVIDLGDLPRVRFEEDREHPRCQNLPLVTEVARAVAERVDEVRQQGRFPIVLGGDCSLTVGVVAGLVPHHRRIGLVYFDADLDLNTPETTPSGALDGMVLAHLLGEGAPELAGIGPRRPLVRDDRVVVFGYDADSGWIDPPELERLERSGMARFPLAAVRDDPIGVAEAALREMAGRADAYLVHFDVDVMNFPAVDVPHPGGLPGSSAFAALRILLSGAGCIGLTVTELNAELDPERRHTQNLVTGLVEAATSQRHSPRDGRGVS